MTTEQRPFTSASFYAYLKEGRFMGVRCGKCNDLSATPRAICRVCHSQELEWTPLAGQGELTTFTAIFIAPTTMVEKGHGRDNPYCSGIVTLAEGLRVSALIGGVDARNPETIALGLPLEIDYSAVDPERPGLVFKPR